jgi:hypothetical protein
MPTATPFTALGKGNGFNSCLTTVNEYENTVLFNEPTLAETMKAYWNLNSVSWGGAVFRPSDRKSDYQPRDIICDKSASSGAHEVGNLDDGLYSVSNSLPRLFVKDNGKKYYIHGIRMSYYIRKTTDSSWDEGGSAISVDYFSTYYSHIDDEAYDCYTIEFPTGPDESTDIGKAAGESSQVVSSVTISGIPFIKIVQKSFGAANYIEGDTGSPLPPCPPAKYPSMPAGEPTLDFYTY